MIVGGLLEALFASVLPDARAPSEPSIATTVRFDEVLTPMLPVGGDEAASVAMADVLAEGLPETPATPMPSESGDNVPTARDENGMPLPLPIDADVGRNDRPRTTLEPAPAETPDDDGNLAVLPSNATAVVPLPAARAEQPTVAPVVTDPGSERPRLHAAVPAASIRGSGAEPIEPRAVAPSSAMEEGASSIRHRPQEPRTSYTIDERPDEGIARALDRLIARASSTHEPASSSVPRHMPAPSPTSVVSTAVLSIAPPQTPSMSLATAAFAASMEPTASTSALSPPTTPIVDDTTPRDPAAPSAATMSARQPSMPPQATAQQPTTPIVAATPTREKGTTDGGIRADEAPGDSRSTWQSALPRELRELAMSPAPHPELARRHSDAMLGTLAERVMVLRAAGQSTASVTLEPESLGRVDVHVRVHAETTHLSFTVQHAAARDVVEANLPRLRTMLEDAGLTLGDVNVGHSDQGSRQSRFEPERRHADGPTLARDDAPSPRRIANDRLVDVRV